MNAQEWRDRYALADAMSEEKLREALALARSMILGGESMTPQAQAIFAAALAAPQGEERYPPRPAPADGALTRENIINILDEESADISKSVSSEDIADRILALFDEEWMEVQAKLTDAVRERDEWKGMASRGATTNVEYMALMEKANDERDLATSVQMTLVEERNRLQAELRDIDERLARRPALADCKTRIEKIELALSTPTAPVDHGSRVLQKMIDEASAKDNSVVRRQCANGHPCDEQWIRCPECGLEAHDMVVG